MKSTIFFLLIAVTLVNTACAQQMALREATVSEVAARTIGFPAVLTPRRIAAFSGTNTLPGIFNSDGTINQLGYGAIGTDYGVAVGWGATAHLNGAAVGYQAAGDGSGVGFGYNARGGQDGTAIGNSAQGQNGGVAIGNNSVAYGSGNIAIGLGADANSVNDFTDTTEIGAGTATVNGALHYRGHPIVSSNGTLIASGSGITGIQASSLVGTVPDSNLSTNVPIQNWSPALLTNNLGWWDFGNTSKYNSVSSPTTLNDLSGNGKTLVLVGNRYITNRLGNTGIYFNSGLATNNTIALSNTFTVYLVVGTAPHPLAGNQCPFSYMSANGSIFMGNYTNSFGLQNAPLYPSMDFGRIGSSSDKVVCDFAPSVMTITKSSTGWRFYMNGRLRGYNSDTNPITEIGTVCLGGNYRYYGNGTLGGNDYQGIINECLVTSSGTESERSLVEAYLTKKWNGITTNDINDKAIFGFGDSITAGATSTNSWLYNLSTMLLGKYPTFNFGYYGHQSSDAVGFYTNISPLLKRNNTVVTAFGANDLAGGKTANQIYTNMLPVWREIRNKGAQVWVTDILWRTNLQGNAAWAAEWTNYNAAIDGWVSSNIIDGHIRYNSNTNLFPWNTNYFADEVHPNTAGQREMAKVVKDALFGRDPLLQSAAPRWVDAPGQIIPLAIGSGALTIADMGDGIYGYQFDRIFGANTYGTQKLVFNSEAPHNLYQPNISFPVSSTNLYVEGHHHGRPGSAPVAPNTNITFQLVWKNCTPGSPPSSTFTNTVTYGLTAGSTNEILVEFNHTTYATNQPSITTVWPASITVVNPGSNSYMEQAGASFIIRQPSFHVPVSTVNGSATDATP